MKEKLQQLTERIYYLPHNPNTDRPILSAIRGDQQTLIIDAGNSSEHAKLFFSEIDQYKITNYHSVVLTHWHWDHSFGTHQMNLITIAHENTKKNLENILDYDWSDEALDKRVANGIENPFCSKMIKKEFEADRNITIISPHITFKDELVINLGGIRCIIKHVGGDHSDDSTLIFVEKEKVLFLGDCLYPSIYTEQPQYTIENIRLLLEKIAKFDAKYYILSHESPLSKEEFTGYTALLNLFCDLIDKHQKNYQSLVAELSTLLRRKINQLEKDIIHCFINGLQNN